MSVSGVIYVLYVLCRLDLDVLLKTTGGGGVVCDLT